MTLPPPTGVEVSANGCPLQRIGGPVPARKLEIDLGLAAGTFHRYVLGPWKAHQFNGFGKNHPEAVAKMRETVALDLRLVSSAIAKVHNDPVLCNRLSTSLNRLHSELANIPVGIPKGHGASIGNAQGALSHTLVRAANSGLKIRETIHTSMVSQS